MSTTTTLTPPISTPRSQRQRLELANQLYREFHSRCFWHSPRDLIITEDLVPFVVKGLRTHGGHRGFILSARLQAKGAILQTSERDIEACR
jgi:hypothetical protein